MGRLQLKILISFLLFLLLSDGVSLSAQRVRVNGSGSSGSGDVSITTGTWTPTDASASGLTLTYSSAVYTKWGKSGTYVVWAKALITYPTTGEGVNASIGGLPFTALGQVDGGVARYTTETTIFTILLDSSAGNTLQLYRLGGTRVLNSQLSADQIQLWILYQTSN
jgi:hypothetical protein